MDFFASQDRARRGSRVLVAGLVVVLLAMAAIVHLVIVGVSMALGGSLGWLEPGAPALVAIALVWTIVLSGGFFRWLDVRAGGRTLARRFGATLVAADAADERVRRLAGTVAEMAIAASCPPPDVFVLERESGINAFVVGAPEHPAVVVSRGALDALERDELRGVVAHEIAHVVAGDLVLNMRMLVVLGALVALDEVGTLLIGERTAPDWNGRNAARAGSGFHPGILIGWPLRALGGIGVLGANVIRSALSRRREFLADATAVEFTRQPFALAAALATIRDADEGGVLHSPHAATLAHLCIHSERRRRWFARPFASHPPLQRRIDALDPHTDVKRRKLLVTRERAARRAGSGSPAAGSPAAGSPAAGSPAGGATAVSPRLSLVGAEDAATTHGPDIDPSGISDRILLMLPDGVDCLAALCALFASRDAIARRDYVDALRFTFDERLAERVAAILPQVAGELEGDRLGLVEHVCGVLRDKVQGDNRRRLLLRLERLLVTRGELDLCGYATLQLVRRKLDVDFPLIDRIASSEESDKLAEGRRVKTFDAMGEEFALLLSLMVESSGAPEAVLDREFQRVLRCYTSASLPRRTRAELGIVTELERAFQTLYVQPKPIRRAFVEHCMEIMHADGHVARAERSLLELFAASLGCEELAA